MVAFYKHDIPAWMDGTEALSDGAYRAYHVICQLIYLNEGPITLNERGIAGRCNQSVKALRRNLDELRAAGKLTVEGGRIANARAAVELAKVNENRLHAAEGGKNSAKTRQSSRKTQETANFPENTNGKSADDPSKPLKYNDPPQAPLPEDRSLKDKTRRDKTRQEISSQPSRTPARTDGEVEAALREVAGSMMARAPRLIVVGPIHALIGEGYSLERHILPVIKAMIAEGKSWSTWQYVVNAVRDRNAVPPPKSVNGQHADIVPDEAKTRRGQEIKARAFFEGRWKDGWSGRPGDPDCTIPDEILAKVAAECGQVWPPVGSDRAAA